MTGDPDAFWLPLNHDTVDVLKLVGLKRSVPCAEAVGDPVELELPQATTAIAAMPTTPIRFVKPRGVFPTPRLTMLPTVIETSL
jgi:hypothetical protein